MTHLNQDSITNLYDPKGVKQTEPFVAFYILEQLQEHGQSLAQAGQRNSIYYRGG